MDHLFGRQPGGDDEHWLSVSDMMAGLMVIFLFIAVTYIRPIVELQGEIRKIVEAWQESEVRIHEALEDEFEEDLPRWQAGLERDTLSIRFNAPEVLFDPATADLKPEFREILADFIPRYFEVLNRFGNGIAEIRIEGHTSSEWEGARTEDEAYFRNMELSQARTRAVLEYAFQLPEIESSAGWARQLITANGLSSSQLVVRDGREDKIGSRRVEFRVVTKTKERVVDVLEALE